jgi:hypothetical protein
MGDGIDMTSQLVIRIEGYPDEVTMPGLALGAEVVTPTVEAEVVTSRVSADIEVQIIVGGP